MHHLQSSEKLFKRLISMSGTPLLMQPLPPPVTEHAYASTLSALGGDCLSADAQVKMLLEAPAAGLWSKVGPTIPLLPSIDNDLVRAGWSFDLLTQSTSVTEQTIPGREWCESLMIGECQFDVKQLRSCPWDRY